MKGMYGTVRDDGNPRRCRLVWREVGSPVLHALTMTGTQRQVDAEVERRNCQHTGGTYAPPQAPAPGEVVGSVNMRTRVHRVLS